MDKFLTLISKKRVITREDEKPYLVRYTLFNFGFISLKIHHILINDDHCMHDHPWPFVSLILKGGYYEITPVLKFTQTTQRIYNNEVIYKWYKAGNILIRPASWVHRLELQPDKTTWTLVLTFSKVRPWGFFTRYGWYYWKDYKSQDHCN